jgi:methionyl-tRNA formyltransferase
MKLRAVFFGSPAFAVPALEALVDHADVVAVVSQPDRPAGRGQELRAPEVKVAAARLLPQVPILQPLKIRTGELEAALRALAPDVAIVVAYGRILHQPLLDLPRFGCWNLHASLLPKFRGAAPIQWSIMRGERETGVSLMRMEAGLDTGPVAATVRCEITAQDTTATLSPRLAAQGAALLVETLPALTRGDLVLQPQDDARATLAPLLTKEDGRLDFTGAAATVSCRARGVDPWPGAWTTMGKEVLKLFHPQISASTGSEAESAPGTIVAIDAQGVHVACGEGVLVFAEVQTPGRKRMPAAAAAAGRALAEGQRLGEDGAPLAGESA